MIGVQRVDFIFVNTQRTIEQKVIGAIITGAEHGEDFTSHVAIRFPQLGSYGPKIIEALADGVVLSDYDKYKFDSKIAYITIELTDDEYATMVNKAIEIIKQKYKYSYGSVVLGFIADNINRQLARLLSKVFRCDTDNKMDCSETGTKLIRTKVTDFCQDFSGAQITPEFFFDRMLVCGYQKRLNIVDAQINAK